jgi:alpha-L-fucosidase 2
MRPKLFWIGLACLLAGIVGADKAQAETPPVRSAEFTGAAAAPPWPLCLWYRQPAGKWEEALPLGNGRIGAMVYGGLPVEHIQFNEDTVWTGQPHSYAHPGAAEALPEMRRLLFEGRPLELEGLKKQKEAAQLRADGKAQEADAKRKEAEDLLKTADAKQRQAQELGMKEFMSVPLHQMAYQPCGDLRIEFPGQDKAADYRRWLDLDRGVAAVEYRCEGVTFLRELFVSYPDHALFARVTADQPGKLNCVVRLTSPHKRSTVTAQDGTLVLEGEVQEGGIRFQSRLVAVPQGGSVAAEKDALRVTGATSVVIRLVAGTNFKNFRDLSADPAERCAEDAKRSRGKSWEQVMAAHVADHQALFRRVSLDLGRSAAASNPTDQRLAQFRTGDDPDLAALVFQYGRYLLIACSRQGGQPANLQGIWNDNLNPPWDSKYTCNINTEMNYWPAEPVNLADCAEPLFDALGELMVSGREVARAHYNARGWVLHHNFDLWRGTAPINASDHGIWVSGGAWLCTHLWDHYLFSGDKDFLARRAYPVMKEAALFFVDYLVEDPQTKWLVSGPSNSPEEGGLVMGPSMDHEIIRSLFGACIEASKVLGVDADLAAKLAEMRPRIAPNQVGQYGQLQEWLEDKDDPKNTHRHVSHLWAIYPGWDITWHDKQLFEAARQSLIYRGDAATGWSMGWKVNLWARFLDGDHALVILRNLLQPVGTVRDQGGLYPNLFDAHPPFQIDGNFGACAGIAEMLLQSHTGEIHFLPALPKAWSAGSVKGLRARGAVTVDMDWKDGQLVTARLTPANGGPVRLRSGNRTVTWDAKAGQTVEVDGELRVIL